MSSWSEGRTSTIAVPTEQGARGTKHVVSWDDGEGWRCTCGGHCEDVRATSTAVQRFAWDYYGDCMPAGRYGYYLAEWRKQQRGEVRTR